MPTSPLIESLGERLDQTLKPLLEGHRECALLDFPNHANVGDSAIWLAEERYLQRAGVQVVYRCGKHNYSTERLASRIGSGPILLHGGGNLGDLWPAHQEFRERVIRAFPRNAIIQLPQSICFENRENLARARAVFNVHERLTILVRDAASLNVARAEFRSPSELCPDMTFALGRLDRPAAAVVPVFWLARSDIEATAAASAEVSPDFERRDWLDDVPGPLGRLDQLLSRATARYPRGSRLLTSLASPQLYRRGYRRLAAERVRIGLRLLASGRVVLTDRLHGYILSLLMGIPHVVLDNSYGKLGSFHRAWTESSPITHWADSAQEGIGRARALAG